MTGLHGVDFFRCTSRMPFGDAPTSRCAFCPSNSHGTSKKADDDHEASSAPCWSAEGSETSFDTDSSCTNDLLRHGQHLQVEFPDAPNADILVFDETISRKDRLNFTLAVTAAAQEVPLNGFNLCMIRVITEPTHPACGEFGLFATVDIPPHTELGPYTGFVQAATTYPGTESYCIGFRDSNTNTVIDPEFAGNFARFANDPNGIHGARANAVAMCKYTFLGEPYTALVTSRFIRRGDELLLDYGKRHHLGGHRWRDGAKSVMARARVCTGTWPHQWSCALCGELSGDRTLSCEHCGEPRHEKTGAVAFAAQGEGEERKQEKTGRREDDDSEDENDDVIKRPTSDKSATWPMTLPFITWQIWDPRIPMSTISAACRQTPPPLLCVGEFRPSNNKRNTAKVQTMELLCAGRRFKKGDVIGAAGGVLMWLWDERLMDYGETDFIKLRWVRTNLRKKRRNQGNAGNDKKKHNQREEQGRKDENASSEFDSEDSEFYDDIISDISCETDEEPEKNTTTAAAKTLSRKVFEEISTCLVLVPTGGFRSMRHVRVAREFPYRGEHQLLRKRFVGSSARTVTTGPSSSSAGAPHAATQKRQQQQQQEAEASSSSEDEANDEEEESKMASGKRGTHVEVTNNCFCCLARDPLGFIYAQLVARCEINEGDELLFE